VIAHGASAGSDAHVERLLRKVAEAHEALMVRAGA
jgi:hypothetical protein